MRGRFLRGTCVRDRESCVLRLVKHGGDKLLREMELEDIAWVLDFLKVELVFHFENVELSQLCCWKSCWKITTTSSWKLSREKLSWCFTS